MITEKEFDKFAVQLRTFIAENMPNEINFIVGLSATVGNDQTFISNVGINSSFRGMITIAGNLNERVIANDKDMTLSKLVELYDNGTRTKDYGDIH